MRKLKLMPKPVAELDGVCSGIAYWLGIPTGLVRILFLLSLFGYGVGICIYFILYLGLLRLRWKEVPEDYEKVTRS